MKVYKINKLYYNKNKQKLNKYYYKVHKTKKSYKSKVIN
jgi:hypothetical protein